MQKIRKEKIFSLPTPSSPSPPPPERFIVKFERYFFPTGNKEKPLLLRYFHETFFFFDSPAIINHMHQKKKNPRQNVISSSVFIQSLSAFTASSFLPNHPVQENTRGCVRRWLGDSAVSPREPNLQNCQRYYRLQNPIK